MSLYNNYLMISSVISPKLALGTSVLFGAVTPLFASTLGSSAGMFVAWGSGVFFAGFLYEKLIDEARPKVDASRPQSSPDRPSKNGDKPQP